MASAVHANVHDLLKGSKPKRLVAEGGEWHLEVQRMVSVGGGILRPETRRISGQRAILEVLGHSEQHKRLRGPTERLFGSQPSESERSFNPVDGSWIPTEIVPSYMESLRARRSNESDERGLVGELLAEVTLLRAAHENILTRLQRLETMVMNGHVAAQSALASSSAAKANSAGPARAEMAPNADEPPGAPASVAEPAEAATGPANVEEPATAEGQNGASEEAPNDSEPEGSSEPEVGEERAPMKMPDLSGVGSLLSQLVGETYKLKALKELPPISQLAGGVASKVVDDADRPVGVMLADMAAAIRLGGTLLMLPDNEIETQIATNLASEDVLSAMSEVFNNLSGTLNQVKGNLHIRSTPIETIDEEGLAPFRNARTHLHAEVVGVGTITVLGR